MIKNKIKMGKHLFISLLCFFALTQFNANASILNTFWCNESEHYTESLRDTIKDTKNKTKRKFSFGSNKVTFDSFGVNYQKAINYYNKSTSIINFMYW